MTMESLQKSTRLQFSELCLRLGDDRLILGHRLSEWCGHAPILEEDIALGNMALDLLGQAQSLLATAGVLEGRGRTDDDFAYHRGPSEFRSLALVELPKGDFAFTILRQFFFSAYSIPLWDILERCQETTLSGVAAKARKESIYHLRHSAEWVVRLGDGTDESKRRITRALGELWRYTGQLFQFDGTELDLARDGYISSLESIQGEWTRVVASTFERATLTVPPREKSSSPFSRNGIHTEHLGHLIAEMQTLPRSFPGSKW